MPVHHHRTRFLRVLAAGAILAAVTAVGLAPSSALLPLLPTTTTVVSNANPALPGATVRYTATVKILGTNLGPITPNGTVTFSVDGAPAATAPLGSCLVLFKQCTASANVTLPLDAGPDDGVTITAKYKGDLLSKPSTGTLFQEINEPTTCNDNFSCSVFEESANGTAALEVQVAGDGQTTPGSVYTIDISFTSDLLSCSRPGTGDVGVFDVSLDREKVVIYDTYNAEAELANQDPNRICWGADSSFTTANGTPAVFIDGLFQGLLPMCAVDGPIPCVDGDSEFRPASDPGCDCDPRARLRTRILAPAGDPHPGR